MELVSPKYSFVQLRAQWDDVDTWYENAAEGSNAPFTLPFNVDPSATGDLVWQFILRGNTGADADAIMMKAPSKFNLFCVSGANRLTPSPRDLSGRPIGWMFRTAIDSSWFTRYRINDTDVLFYIYAFPEIPAVGGDVRSNHVDECFQLQFSIYETIHDEGTSFISNNFMFVRDLNYTTFLRYQSYVNTADFVYCTADTGLRNSALVPMYLAAPQYPEEVSMYRKSDGTFKTTKEQVSKQYDCKTDYLPEWVHDCLRAALMHDIVYVRGKRYTGQVKKNGAYNPKWEDNDYPAAQVTFKLDVSGFLIKSNDCTVCAVDSPGTVIITGPAVPSTPGGGTTTLPLPPMLPPGAPPLPWFFEIAPGAGDLIADAAIVDTEEVGDALVYTITEGAAAAENVLCFYIWAASEDIASNVVPVYVNIT